MKASTSASTAAAAVRSAPPVVDRSMRYDMRGRLLSVGTPEAPDRYARYAYDPDGRANTERLADASAARTFKRDPLGRLIALRAPAFTQTLSFREDGDPRRPYAGGHITAEATRWPNGDSGLPDRSLLYRYDAFGRLVSAQEAEGRGSMTLVFDANDNISTLQRDGDGTNRCVYRQGTNRLARIDTPSWQASFGYAPDGAMTSHGGLGLSLARDRLTGRTVGAERAQRRMRYGYDGQGLRVSRAEGATRLLTLRAPDGTPLVELDEHGNPTVHVQGLTGLVAWRLHGVDHTVDTDSRGSVRSVRAFGAAVAGGTARFAYGPFGELLASEGTLADSVRRRYGGHCWDPGLGLYDFGARLYDPRLTRFLGVDPRHETPSPYAYVGNDPIGSIDPDGRGRVAVFFGDGRYFAFKPGDDDTFHPKAQLVLEEHGLPRGFLARALGARPMPWHTLSGENIRRLVTSPASHHVTVIGGSVKMEKIQVSKAQMLELKEEYTTLGLIPDADLAYAIERRSNAHLPRAFFEVSRMSTLDQQQRRMLMKSPLRYGVFHNDLLTAAQARYEALRKEYPDGLPKDLSNLLPREMAPAPLPGLAPRSPLAIQSDNRTITNAPPIAVQPEAISSPRIEGGALVGFDPDRHDIFSLADD